MKNLWVFTLLMLFPGITLFADGKMYRPVVEDIPVGISYQRALLLHHDQTQTLLLQSQYQLPKDAGPEELAWVIPLPSVPGVFAVHPKEADNIFRYLDFDSAPTVHRISSLMILMLVFLIPLCTVISLILAFRQKPGSRKRGIFLRLAVYPFVFWILGMITLPALGTARSGSSSVEVVIDKQVGVYAVQVIRSEDANAIADWLKTHGFAYDDQDLAYFESHVQKQGCFVTARINLVDNTGSETFPREGLTDPLLFQFTTPQPMYPLALTGSAGADTTVLLYLLSDQPHRQDAGLELKYSGNAGFSGGVGSYLGFYSNTPEFEGFKNPPEETYHHLMKFKATLTPEQMREDLIFIPDPGQPDYRESTIRW